MADGRILQIRDMDPRVMAGFEEMARERGQSLAAYLRGELADLYYRKRALEDWWRDRPESIGRALTQEDIDDWKAERDAGREWM